MTDTLDDFVEKSQQEMIAEVRAQFGEKILRHWMHADHMGRVEKPDGEARLTGPCGDTMSIFLKVDERETISRAGFITDGCGPTTACGNMLCELVSGMSVDQAWAVDASTIVKELERLPEDHHHCASLAVTTFRLALTNYMDAKEGRANEGQAKGNPRKGCP